MIQDNSSQLPSLRDSVLVDWLNDRCAENILHSRKDSAVYYTSLATKEAKKINYIHGMAVASSRRSQMAKHFDADHNAAGKFAEQALRYYGETPNQQGIDSVFYELFWAALMECRFDEAMDYCERYYHAAVLSGDQKEIFSSLTGMFTLNRQTGNYEKGFQYAEQLYDIAAKEKNKLWMANSLWDLAELYTLTEDYPGALNYYAKIREMSDREISEDRVNTDNEIWFDMEFTEAFSLTNQFDSAWHYYGLFKPSNDAYNPIYQVSTGECHLLQGNFKQALQNFQLGLTGHRKQHAVYEVIRSLLDISKVYLALDNSPAALQFAREGLDMALQVKVKQFIRDGYKALSDGYDRMRRTDSSDYYFRKYTIVKDAVLNDQAKGKIAAYDFQQKISLMNVERQLQEMSLQKERLIKNMLIGGIAIVLLLALFVFRNGKLKHRYEARRRELAENQLRIQKLEAEKTQAELLHQKADLEMKALRAQMNPHFIFNCLNSINRFIIRHDAEKAADYLTKFARLIRMVLERSGASFVPLEEELNCLKLYMDLEAIRFERPFTYKMNCHEIDKASVMIPSLLIQPFVENAIWHGLHPLENVQGEISIDLNLENDKLHCKISDNGIGRMGSAALKWNGGDSKRSLGIELTQQRLRLATPGQHGSMGIIIQDLIDETGKNKGTCVNIQIPVKTV